MTKTTWPLAAALALALSTPGFAAPNPIGYTAPDGVNAVAVTAASPLPVTPVLAAAASTDASGAVTTGGTYQTVLAANAARKGCLIQNPVTATEVLSVKVGTMSAPFTVPAGGSFSCAGGNVVVTDAITATAATAGHAFSAVSQ
jgi:hypothetical protein